MKITVILSSIFLFLLSCAEVNSSPAQITGLRLLDYGLLHVNIKKTKDKSTTATGKHNVVESAEFYKRTSEIIAKKKTTFGVKYQVNGTQTGKIVNLTYKVLHPPIQGKTMSSVKVKGTIGSWRADFYTFEEDYELVEGNWKMQILDGNKVLLEKIFTVTH